MMNLHLQYCINEFKYLSQYWQIQTHESILKILHWWVNVDGYAQLSQFQWIYPDKLIWTNLNQWFNINNICNRVDISKSTPQVDIDTSTWQSQCWWMYPMCLIQMKLHLLIKADKSISDESILSVQYQWIYTNKLIWMSQQPLFNVNGSTPSRWYQWN